MIDNHFIFTLAWRWTFPFLCSLACSTHLLCLLSWHPICCSWSRHNQPAASARSGRKPQRWCHRWCCHGSRGLAPGLRGGQTACRWHRQSLWQRRCHWERTGEEKVRMTLIDYLFIFLIINKYSYSISCYREFLPFLNPLIRQKTEWDQCFNTESVHLPHCQMACAINPDSQPEIVSWDDQDVQIWC